MPLQEAQKQDFLSLIEYDVFLDIFLDKPKKGLLAVDCSCVITLGMSPVKEYGVVWSA